MSATRISRRRLVVTGPALAAGVVVAPRDCMLGRPTATPQPVQVSQGYVSTRVRTVASADTRSEINGIVLEEFIPVVQRLEGYAGYLLGDVVGNDAQSLSVVVLEDAAQADAFADLTADFADDLGDLAESIDTTQWEGGLLITGAPAGQLATPPAAEAGSVLRDGHVVVRVHQAAVGTSPHDFIPLGTEGFIAGMETLEGFRGYLWYPTEDGFVSISLFVSADAAGASGEEVGDRETELHGDATAAEPEIYNAAIVWSELPVLSIPPA